MESVSNWYYKKKCIICGIEARNKECLFPPEKQRCYNCLNKKKCFICKEIKSNNDFYKDKSKSDGLNGKCKKCSNKRIKDEKYYIRHRKYDKNRRNRKDRKIRDFLKDCLKRLKLNKNSKSYLILGFNKEDFNNKFPLIPKGYDLDHCIPLSWFKEGTPLSISCGLDNLQLLEHKINGAKGNYFCHQPSDPEFFTKNIHYIKEKYLEKCKNFCTLWADLGGAVHRN